MTSGDIKRLDLSNSTYGGFSLEVKATDDVTFIRGGLRNADEDGDITNFGRKFYRKNMIPNSLKVTGVDTEGAYTYLCNISTDTQETTITVVFADDQTESFNGSIVGEIAVNKQAGTIEVKFSGSVRL